MSETQSSRLTQCSSMDILYRSVNPDILRHTFSGHSWLAGGKRFIPTEHDVVLLEQWPPAASVPPEAADFLVLESAIQAGISDPFIWLDSSLFVVGYHATGWLNADLAIQDSSPTTIWLQKQGLRAYNYNHCIPVAVSHSQVRTLHMMYSSSVLISKCIKTLLVNLDSDRQGRKPIWLESLPMYQHLVSEEQILKYFPVFFTCDKITPEILAYAQN